MEEGNYDRFFFELFSGPVLKREYSLMWDVIRLALTLYHGQASVERGFSITLLFASWSPNSDSVKRQLRQGPWKYTSLFSNR